MPEMNYLAAQALILCGAYDDFLMLNPKATFDLWEEIHNRAQLAKFQAFFDENMTEEEEWRWA
jgi:hypothetical protein